MSIDDFADAHADLHRVADYEPKQRKTSGAIRVTFANGRDAFVRRGRVLGRGPIATFYNKAQAEAEAVAFIQEGAEAGAMVTVIERSHGRNVSRVNG